MTPALRVCAVLGAAAAIAAALVFVPRSGQSARGAPSLGAPVADGGPSGRRALAGTWYVRLGAGTRRYPEGRFKGRPVRVPYSPNARRVTTMASYNGAVGWYRTDFSLAAAGDYALRFESVNHRAHVWLDGRPVARHTGAYLPFEVRRALRAGRHRLVVRADWRDPESWRTSGWFRSWFNFGGIDREVTIRRLAASELDAPGLQTRLVNGAPAVTVTVRVHNRAARRTVTVRGNLGGTVLVFPPVRLGPRQTAWVTARASLPGAPLWSPANPTLLPLELLVPGETRYAARVGLREIRRRGGRLFLNGRPLVLRGAGLQEDARGRGDALTGADMDAVVARLKAIGANATRAQHALNPALLERLDRAGILVWQEVGPHDVPGRWAARSEGARALALRRVRQDVLDMRLHPSVLVWNLANEVAFNGDPLGQRDHIVQGARIVRSLDSGRPVALDVWGTHMPRHPGRIYRAVDAVGATDYEGWYANLLAPGAVVTRNIRAWLRRLHARFPGKVLAVTEFGAEGNRLNPAPNPGGLRFQARLLGRHIRAYKADRRLSGMLLWSLEDFALRPSFLGGSVRSQDRRIVLQRGINAKGLFTYAGRPKPAVAMVRRLYR